MTDVTDKAPYADVDEASDERRRQLLAYLESVSQHPEMQRVRTTAWELFAPSAGERLLDAGCGLGEVARQLATQVAPSGSVTAVDRSAQAIALARSRDPGGAVTYAVGDITALDFPDGHFDGVRTERVLQHLSDIDAAIKELARVTRPGGRVCVVETDWSSAVWDGFDDPAALMRLHPGDQEAGRTIRSRMVRAGLEEIRAFPVTLRFTTPEDAAVIAPFFSPELVEGHLPADVLDPFFASVERSTERGDFLFAFTMWTTVGRVPAVG